jgi:hypothetical protein
MESTVQSRYDAGTPPALPIPAGTQCPRPTRYAGVGRTTPDPYIHTTPERLRHWQQRLANAPRRSSGTNSSILLQCSILLQPWKQQPNRQPSRQ